MARKGKGKGTEGKSGDGVLDLRHTGVTRLNIPPAGLTARGELVRERKLKYAYNPHLTPVLRFDGTGGADGIKELLEEAGRRKLEPDELKMSREALGNHEPWLEWAGKREQQWCVADPVALHIHERISTQAILKVAKRENPRRGSKGLLRWDQYVIDPALTLLVPLRKEVVCKGERLLV